MREMPWSLLLGVIVAAFALPALGGRLSYHDESFLTGERGGRDETDNQQLYEEVSKRALVALSRFKPFASALSPDFHRYAARSYLSGIDASSLTVADRRGRPAQNPMRFGR